MEQHHEAAAALGGGDERRAVAERGPGALGEAAVGLGQHLAADGDVVRHGEIVERPLAREARELLRLLPRERAAEHAAAAAELHRNQIILCRGQPRPGEAHEHASLLHPGDEAGARLGRDGADVGQHQHRQALLEEAVHRLAGRRAFGEAHVGEGPERPRQVIGSRQERLAGIGGGAGDDADGAPPPALVEELHGAGRALADDLEARDVVPDLHRQIEVCLGLAGAGVEDELGVAERKAAEITGAHETACGRGVVGAQHADGKAACRVVGGDERAGAFDAAGDDADAAGGEARQRLGETRAVAEVGAV